MLANQPYNQEKRQGPDILVKWVRIARFFAWIMLGIFLVITDTAKPQTLTFWDRFLDVKIRGFWDQNLLFIAFIVAVILFIFSFVSILINAMRLKRKTDRLCISLLITLIISSIGILFYLTIAFS